MSRAENIKIKLESLYEEKQELEEDLEFGINETEKENQLYDVKSTINILEEQLKDYT